MRKSMPSVPVILRNWVIVLVSVLKDGPVRARPGNGNGTSDRGGFTGPLTAR